MGIKKPLNRLKYILNKMHNNIVNQLKVNMVEGIKTNLNKHKSYKQYIAHQKIKTKDPVKIKKWLGGEWEVKYQGFKEIYARNDKYTKDKKNAICLGSRAGQEVKALLDIGIDAIGIDLVEFLPYTIKGDIHNLEYEDEKFDFIFTNIMDHSLYPEVFCSEMQRVCSKYGIIIIHFQLGEFKDLYTETIINDPKKIISYFNEVEVLESRLIKNSHDYLDWELIFKKIKL